jgi:hypothetical protein
MLSFLKSSALSCPARLRGFMQQAALVSYGPLEKALQNLCIVHSGRTGANARQNGMNAGGIGV